MTTADKALIILLHIIGVSSLFALVAVLMPMSWMVSTHRWLGLGEMPSDPVVEYLARCVSVFYALVGVLCLGLAADPQRYRPLVVLLGVLVAVFGIVLIGIDLVAHMPCWWALSEGPTAIVFGILMAVLARRGG